MKNRYSTTYCIMMFFLTTQFMGYAQPVLSWDRTKNGPANVEDRGFKIVVDDSSKNVYVASRSIGVNTNYDILTIKYSASGQELWANRYAINGNLAEEPVAIKLNGLNSVFVLGKSINASGAAEMQLIKYDTQGNLIWNKLFNNATSTGDDIPQDITFDDFGNIYVVGSSVTSGSGGQHYPVLIKYTSDGMFVWAKAYNNVGANESGIKVKLNHIPNLVILVTNTDNVTLGILEVGLNDGVVIREYISQDVGHNFDILGIPNDFLVDPSNGNMWVLGTDGVSNSSESRVYTCKYNYGNVEHLARTWYPIPSQGNVVGVALSFDKDKNVYTLIEVYNGIIKHYLLRRNAVAGNGVWNKNYFGPGGQDYIPVSMMVEEEISDPSIYVGGYNESGDIFITKHNSMNGDSAWTMFYDCGNHQPDVASAFVQDDYDNFYITGYSSCNGTGNDIKTIKYCLHVPEIPDTINGPVTVCLGDAVTYNVPIDTTVESYTWFLPPGWVGETVGDTIHVVTGSSGSLSVVANGRGCSSDPKLVPITVLTIPASPIEIVGDDEVCSGSNVEFIVSAVPGASSYTWNHPLGWSGSSTTNEITVQPDLISGNLTVTANNVCGSSPETNLFITVSETPATPTSIIGDNTICSGTPQVYEVTAVSGISHYWSGPQDWGVQSTPGNTIICVPTGTGILSVFSQQGECSSAPLSITIDVNTKPIAPDTIEGDNTLCGTSSAVFEITPVDGAAYYTWGNTSNWTGQSDSTSISYEVDSSGTITVVAGNECGVSEETNLQVIVNQTVPAQPVSISGNTIVCPNSDEIYSVLNQQDALEYIWTPASWGTSNTNTFQASIGSQGGTITVFAYNSCGFSESQSLSVEIIDSTITYSGTSVSSNQEGVEYQWVTCPDFLIIPGENGQEFTPPPGFGDYAVILTSENCSVISECLITSIDHDQTSPKISTTPNPFSDYFTLDKKLTDFKDINIYDAFGKSVIYSSIQNSNGTEFNLSGNPSGIYVLELISFGKRMSYMLLKI